MCAASARPSQPAFLLTHLQGEAVTGLLFSEDIQLDVPSHWRTTSQLVLEEGGGPGGGDRRETLL